MALENLRGTLDEAQVVMEERLGTFRPEVGLILGSGLGPLAERIADPVFVPFGEVPGMGVSTANGHVGRFVAGMLGGVLAMGVIVLRSMLNNKIMTDEDITQKLGLPVLGVIPDNAACARKRGAKQK